MINRLLNTFIPFTLTLLVITVAIIWLDSYAKRINKSPEIIKISSVSHVKDDLSEEFQIEADHDNNEFKSDTLFVQGENLFEASKYNEAEKYFNQLNKIFPNNRFIINKLGIIKLKKKQFSEAIDYFKKCTELDSRYTPAYTNLGIAYSKMYNYTKAEKAYLKAIEIQPENRKAFLNLGILYAKEENWQKAINYSEKAAELSSGTIRAKAKYYAGMAYMNIGKPHLAKEHFKEAILLKPNYILPRIKLALLEESPDKIKKHLNDVIALDPTFPEAYYQLSILYTEEGNNSLAERNIKKAYELDPDNQEILGAYGDFLISQDRIEEVNELYSTKLQKDSLHPQSYFNIAKLSSAKKEFNEAEIYYEKAIQLAEGYYPKAYLNMGVVETELNKYPEAMNSYKKALYQNNSYHEANYNLALLYLEMKDTSKAVENYRKG